MLLALAVAIDLTLESPVEAAPTPKERFLAEAPGQWASYRRFTGRLQGKIQHTQVDRRANRPVFLQEEYEVKQAGVNSLYVTQEMGPGSHIGRARVQNADYGFLIDRRTATSPWVITSLERGVVQMSRPVSDLVSLWQGYNVYIYLCRLSDTVRQPEFVLGDVQVLNQGERELVQVDFTYANQDPGDGRLLNYPIRSGWVRLDPARFWVIKEYNVNAEWVGGAKGTMVGTFDWRLSSDGYPIVTKHVRRQQADSKEGPMDHDHIYEFDLHERAEVPASEFRLPAFGLPEPPGLTSASSRLEQYGLFIWAVGIGVGFLLLAAMFRGLARRAAARVTQKRT